MTSPRRYRLTPAAAAEFEREMIYSARHWGKRHAQQYASGLREKMRLIARNPLAYPLRPVFGPDVRMVVYKGTRILYIWNPDEEVVEILGLPGLCRDLSLQGAASPGPDHTS